MSRELLERVKALMPLASKDETRERLCGVALSKGTDQGDVLLEVCDGHRMVQETVRDVDLEIDGKIIIKRTQLPIIKNALKDGPLFLFSNNKEFSFISIDRTHLINYETIENYPDLSKLIPKKDGQFRFGVNAKYLYEIAKALKEDSKHTDQIEIVLDFNDGIVTKPMIVKKNGKQAVLMPVRV